MFSWTKCPSCHPANSDKARKALMPATKSHSGPAFAWCTAGLTRNDSDSFTLAVYTTPRTQTFRQKLNPSTVQCVHTFACCKRWHSWTEFNDFCQEYYQECKQSKDAIFPTSHNTSGVHRKTQSNPQGMNVLRYGIAPPVIYTVSQKNQFTFAHNFAKC